MSNAQPFPEIQSQVTFLYYDDMEEAAAFYADIMGFESVMEQPLARIFRIADEAYLGVVDGTLGFHRPQEKSAVVVSLTVEDVRPWYAHLVSQGVKILTGPEEHELAPVESFFFEDPGGYTLELQRFLEGKQL